MFRNINVGDYVYFKQFNNKNYQASELNFANIFVWKEFDQLKIYVNDAFLIIKGKNFFFPPLAKNQDYAIIAIQWIQNYCKTTLFPFRIVGITKSLFPILNLDNVRLYSHRSMNEYIYDAQILATFRGKKLHAKRNFVNQFQKKYQYQCIPYTSSMRDEVIHLIHLWAKTKEITYEKIPILSALDNLEALDCVCDCLVIDGAVQAFSIATMSSDTGIILFEKANIAYAGIYPMLIQLTVQKHFSNVSYINRQEDMGNLELRKSKLSYYPAYFVEKYQLVYSLQTQLQQLYALSFFDSPAYIDFFFFKKHKQLLYIKQNNIIISTLYYREQTLIINQKPFKAAFVFALATHPHYRRQGWMKKLMRKALKTWYNEGFDVAYLHPDVDDFYEKLGFAAFGGTTTSIPENTVVTKDIDGVRQVYDTFALRFDIFTERSASFWSRLHEEVTSNHGYFAIVENKKMPTGYIIHDGDDIIEACDLNGPIKTSKSNYLRIVNLSSCLEKITLEANNLLVVDPLLPINTSAINPDQTPPKQESIKTLTELLLHNLSSLSYEKY